MKILISSFMLVVSMVSFHALAQGPSLEPVQEAPVPQDTALPPPAAAPVPAIPAQMPATLTPAPEQYQVRPELQGELNGFLAQQKALEDEVLKHQTKLMETNQKIDALNKKKKSSRADKAALSALTQEQLFHTREIEFLKKRQERVKVELEYLVKRSKYEDEKQKVEEIRKRNEEKLKNQTTAPVPAPPQP